jgi:hypothetical protein
MACRLSIFDVEKEMSALSFLCGRSEWRRREKPRNDVTPNSVRKGVVRQLTMKQLEETVLNQLSFSLPIA